jgi:transcriptional repressor NrdR
MKCPFCGSLDSRVVDSRPTDEGASIRRRRECIECTKRFTTYEKIETLPIFVIKKDGRRESFDGNKIMVGLVKACEKRPVAIKDLDKLVQDIEKAVYNSLEQEITSERIGQMVMERLKKV